MSLKKSKLSTLRVYLTKYIKKAIKNLLNPARKKEFQEKVIINILPVNEFLRIIEVSNAEPYVKNLFLKKFNCSPPETPNHFVLQYVDLQQPVKGWISCGYVHYSPYMSYQMCGGLVMDELVYKAMRGKDREIIRRLGGLAEIIMRKTLNQFPEAEAIWGHVGNKLAEKVDLRVGFVYTDFPHLMVVWQKEFSEEEKFNRSEEISQIGPF